MSSIPGVFYLLDAAGRVVKWNTHERDVVTGKSESEMSQTFAMETIRPDDRPFAEQQISEVMEKISYFRLVKCTAMICCQHTKSVRVFLQGFAAEGFSFVFIYLE